MAVSLREYRARIKSTESMKKITRAMELIAASRIIKAQQRAQAAAPYARELTRAVSAVATFSNVDHPLTTEPEDPKRAAVLIVTSDRGLAGAYSSSVLKETERLVEKLREEGKEVETYICGRKGEAYYKFRNRPVVQSWSGFSDQPNYDVAREVGEALIGAFLLPEDEERPEDSRASENVHTLLRMKLKTIAVSVATRTATENPRRVSCVPEPRSAEAATNVSALTMTPRPPTMVYLRSVSGMYRPSVTS